MLYDLAVRIAYSYDEPALIGRNLLRIAPAEIPDRQRVLACTLRAEPAPAERSDRLGFFGTPETEMAFHTTTDTLVFTLGARVEVQAARPGLDLSPPLAALPREIAGERSLGAGAPHHFLGPSPRVPEVPEIAAFAVAAISEEMSTLEAVLAIGRAIHAHMRFDGTATTVETGPAEAFGLGHGVCQDFTHVMLAALRGCGIPAGYVSGYMRTLPPPGQPRLQGADAMHAWVRAWCGAESGWVEYDPTNALVPGSDHIVAGFGRDYDAVAPVQGLLRIAGGQSSVQSVDTVPVD